MSSGTKLEVELDFALLWGTRKCSASLIFTCSRLRLEPGQDLYPPGCVLPMLLSFARAYNAFDKAGELANPGS